MSLLQTSAFEALNKEIAGKIDSIIVNNGNDSSKLVGILLEVQEIIPRHYIPLDAATYISQKMDIPLVRIYDAISFYDALSDAPKADCVIQICDSVVCKVTDNTILKDSLQELLGIKVNEATPNGRFALEYTTCFGACDISPAIRVNGKAYGHLTSKEKVRQVLEMLDKEGGQI